MRLTFGFFNLAQQIQEHPSTEMLPLKCDPYVLLIIGLKTFSVNILFFMEKYIVDFTYIGLYDKEYYLLPYKIIFNQVNYLSQIIRIT